MDTLNNNSVEQFKNVDLSIDTDKSLFSQAEALVESGDFPSALKVYHQLLDKMQPQNPLHFEVFKNMGNIYLKCGDIEAAEEKYNQANAINSEDENLIINYGVLEIQKGQYTAAKQRFARVIEQNNGSDLAWVGLALVHRAYSDHDLARACVMRGLDENPENKLAITNYYQWCYQDGVDATSQYINDFLERHPEDQDMLKLSHGLSQ